MGVFVDGNVLSAADLNDFGAVDSIDVTQTTTTGVGLDVSRNLASGSTDSTLVKITQDNAGDDQIAFRVVQDGTADATDIDQNGSSGRLMFGRISAAGNASDGIDIRHDGTGFAGIFKDGTTNIVELTEGGASTSSATATFYRNLAAADTSEAMITITQDNAGDDQQAVKIINDGTAYAILCRNAASPTNYAYLVAGGANTDARTGWFYRNLASASTAEPMVFIHNDNAGDDQAALSINQDSANASILVDQNGNSGAAVGAVDIDNDGNDDFGLYVHTTKNADADEALVKLHIETSTFNHEVLEIVNGGGGESITMTNTSAGDECIKITHTSAADCIDIFQDIGAPGTPAAINIDGDTTVTGSLIIMDHRTNGGVGIEIDMNQAADLGVDILGAGTATGGFSTACPFMIEDGLNVKNGIGGINHGQLVGRDVLIGFDGIFSTSSNKLNIPSIRFTRLNKSTVIIEERTEEIDNSLFRDGQFKLVLAPNEHLNSVESIDHESFKTNKGNKGTLEEVGDYNFVSTSGKIRYK